ncbi:hypothetical protein F3J19_26690 [Burkholderia sp. Ax-1724]|nr:hypothetical protein [Burkholderia sp. Ax-1724]NIF77957.1 hypothetical protein [Paraburkholderia sp. Cy-641]
MKVGGIAESQSRQLHRLSTLRSAKLVDSGYYADGGGLYFQISSYTFMRSGAVRLHSASIVETQGAVVCQDGSVLICTES